MGSRSGKPRRWRKALGWASVLLVAFGLVGVWLVGSALTRATNTVVAAAPAPAVPVQLSTEDNMEIAGSYWSPPETDAPAILLLHGNGGNRQDLLNMATWLAADGYAVLSIDMRGHGESTPAEKSFGYFEARDAHAAMAWLKETHPESKIGVIGFSLGGAAAVLGEAGPLGADAFVIMSVYPDIRSAIFNRIRTHSGAVPAYVIEPLLSYQSLPRYGVAPSALSPIAALSNVSAPVMLVGGELDLYTPPTEIEDLYNAAPKGSEWWILGGLGHDDVVRTTDAAFRMKLQVFLGRNLKS